MSYGVHYVSLPASDDKKVVTVWVVVDARKIGETVAKVANPHPRRRGTDLDNQALAAELLKGAWERLSRGSETRKAWKYAKFGHVDLVRLLPNGSRLSCGRNTRWRKAAEPQQKGWSARQRNSSPTSARQLQAHVRQLPE